MNGNYAKWLENEKTWIDDIEKKSKKERNLWSLLLLVGCIVFFGAIGLLASGSIDIDGMLRNILFGFIFGVVCVIFIWIMMLAYYPSKRYMINLKDQIENVLSSEEREEFAFQMLNANDSRDFSWTTGKKWEGITEWKVRISKDYAIQTCSNGGVQLVQLHKVKQIEVDVRENTAMTFGNGIRIRTISVVYPMFFHYHNTSVNGEKKEADREFIFNEREIREQISHHLHEMKIGE